MRTITTGGITIQYPEQIILTNNRNIITISGATGYDTFEIYGDTRELFSGGGEFDLSPYFNSLFSSETKNGKILPKTDTQTLTISDSTNTLPDITEDLVFTEIYIGKNDIFDIRKLPKFGEFSSIANFYDFWLPADITAEINGVSTPLPAGYNSIDLSNYTVDVLIRFENTFDDTFDDTFYPGVDPVYLNYISCPENGITLRWLDKWGIWQTKCFDLVNKNNSANSVSFNWNNSPGDIIYSGLQFTKKKKIKSYDLQAAGQLQEEAERLSELCSSNFVHIWDTSTNQWLPVAVSTNEIPVAANKPSQSINLSVILQNEY